MQLHPPRSVVRCLRLVLAATLAAGLAIAVPAATASPISQHVIRIYPLGDSITYGATGMTTAAPQFNRTPGGYREPLDEMLSNAGLWHQFIGTRSANSTPLMTERGQQWHDGHGGYRIDQINSDLAGVAGGDSDGGGRWITGISGVRGPLDPQIVVIHLGTNDIAQRWDPARRFPTAGGWANLWDPTQRAEFINDMTGRLGTLITSLYRLRPNVKIVLSDIIPIGRVVCDPVTPEYARAVRNLALYEQHLGRRVAFADVFNSFVVRAHGVNVIRPGLKDADLYHPTPLGYQVMAEVYFRAIMRLT